MDSFDQFAAAVGEGADGSDEDAVVSVVAVTINITAVLKGIVPEFSSKISCPASAPVRKRQRCLALLLRKQQCQRSSFIAVCVLVLWISWFTDIRVEKAEARREGHVGFLSNQTARIIFCWCFAAAMSASCIPIPSAECYRI